MKKHSNKPRFRALVWVLVAFVVLFCVLVFERSLHTAAVRLNQNSPCAVAQWTFDKGQAI